MKLIHYFMTLTVSVLMSCGAEYLEVKQVANMVIPSTLEDYQRILDNGTGLMNSNQSYRLGFVGNDEYFLTDAGWNALQPRVPFIIEKWAYLWADDPYQNHTVDDWNNAYARILHANLVLDGLKNLPAGDKSGQRNNIEGSALFFRAYNYYQLAQLFCPPFDRSTVDREPGLPLRVEADVSMKVPRATLRETYDLILQDMKAAAELLPSLGEIKLRPSKVAAYAVLARTYLQMGDYESAGYYAGEGLKIHSELIDYGTLPNREYPFNRDWGETNTEIVFSAQSPPISVLDKSRMNVDPALLGLYDDNDLRRTHYFKKHANGNLYFSGSYHGFTTPFVGVTTSELLLIKAECDARLGRISDALADIGRLAVKRMIGGTFDRFEVTDADQVLAFVLNERRRELAFRGLRWEDLRRLNKDPGFAEILTRKIEGVEYVLVPNDLRYTWPIPPDVIMLGGLEQNQR